MIEHGKGCACEECNAPAREIYGRSPGEAAIEPMRQLNALPMEECAALLARRAEARLFPQKSHVRLRKSHK